MREPMHSVQFTNQAETLETLRMATDAAGVGVWDRDLVSGELHWSTRCREIFGADVETEPGYDLFLELTHPEDRDKVHATIQEAFDPAGLGEYELEYRICRRGQELRWVHAKGKCFFQDSVDGRKAIRFVGTLIDRTDQKLSQHALLQAEQLAATGRLAASIAHEINNPLEAVTNLLYLLRTETDEQERQAYLNQAESELARVSEISTNTLSFHRDPVGVTDVNLLRLIQSVLILFQGRVKLSRFQIALQVEEVHVQAAQGELRQVLVNLVSNALDAMSQGGCLRIRCRRLTRDIGGLRKGVRITVSDDGHGMCKETLDRLFQAFYTTKGIKGTGLGLWLSMELLRKHGCNLRVKSKVAKGTTFVICLPEPPKTA